MYPYPYDVINKLSDTAKAFLVVELNAGQMVEDVRLAVNGKKSVHFFGKMGGIIPSPEEIVEQMNNIIKKS